MDNSNSSDNKEPVKPVVKKTTWVSLKNKKPSLRAENAVFEVSDLVFLKGEKMVATPGFVRRALTDVNAHHMTLKKGQYQYYSQNNVFLDDVTHFITLSDLQNL